MSSILRVVVAASTQDLTTLATAKEELGVSGTAEDNKILAHIRQASSQISSYCNRVFGLETVEETFVGTTFSRALVLRRRPVAEINTITVSESELDVTEYHLDNERGILYRHPPDFFSIWTSGDIVVNYDAGYDLLDGLPHAVERACLLLVKKFYATVAVDPNIRSEDIPGVASYTYGNVTSTVNGQLPPEVASLVDSFKEPCVA